MKFKKKLFPPSFVDLCCVIFVLFIIPIGYLFHIHIALPFYFTDQSSFTYFFHSLFSAYALVNVASNYVASILVDTSIRGVMMPANIKWKLCTVCECFVPPRTWHCDTCKICIFKRDHHCLFTAGCIGQLNERYFLMFLFHLMLSTGYASYFNVYYLKETFDLHSWTNVFKIIFPFAILLSGFDTSTEQLYRVQCLLTIVGCVASGMLFIYHMSNVVTGQVMYEKSNNVHDYDLGSWVSNIKITLGDRWYLTWILPFISSPLPYNGINWDEVKLNSSKMK